MTKLHRYHSGRYQLKKGPIQVVFSSTERTAIKGDFNLLNEDGEIVGRVDRFEVNNPVMEALDDLSEGVHLSHDEWVDPQR